MSRTEPPVTHHYKGEEFDDEEGPPYDDVEVATISSDISAIRNNAFKWCTWLHTVTIPNNIQTIGVAAFYYCPRLTSISLPASVTTIKDHAFCKCESLTSISLPASVTTIQRSAFSSCYNLTNINIPPSSNLTTIEERAFQDCSMLISISLPPSVTTIQSYAFRYCKQLQMITLPKHATVEDDAFDKENPCDPRSMLQKSNQPDIVTWLKTRFDDLPLHQFCYNISDTTTDISTIQINNQALTTQDALGMTPIHVLISNPFATPDMIRQLVSNNRDAAQITNIEEKTPLHMYLNIKSPGSSLVYYLSQNGIEHDIHDIIVNMGGTYEVMDVALALSGRCIEAELSSCNGETGLYPFMSAAVSRYCKLVDVYNMAIASVDNL